MESFRAVVASVQQLIEPHPLTFIFVTLSVLALAVRVLRPASSNQPPALSDRIPYVSNTYQYLTDMKSFMKRATVALQKENIARFKLGPNTMYMVTGAQNVQSFFRSSSSISPDSFTLRMMETLWNATPADLAKFTNDKSGRLKTPAPGTEATPPQERYWAGFHHTLHEYLARTHSTNRLGEEYYQHFSRHLERFPEGEWAEIELLKFLRKDMAEAAITSLIGPKVFELSPNYLQLLWDYDDVAAKLVWGLPRWMDRESWRRSDRFLGATGKWLDAAWANFDWDGPDADADWEENFGSRWAREMAKWMKSCNFSPRTSAGIMSATGVFGLNSNTIPIATWGIIELARDQSLLRAAREEVLTAYSSDPSTGRRSFDIQKLLVLPLLQSIYVEVLRLHMSINLTREVTGPIKMEGYELQMGTFIQAPSQVAHYNEKVYAAEGHPASEFWAGRHITCVDATSEDGAVRKVSQFQMRGKPSDFFPFGGGISMCPGRFFAKQEIIMSLAMLIARFEIEFVEWVMPDGSPSDRPGANDMRYAGALAMPPDRDMKVRWKRLW